MNAGDLAALGCNLQDVLNYLSLISAQEFAITGEIKPSAFQRNERIAHQPLACCINLCFSLLLAAVSKGLHTMQMKHVCELLGYSSTWNRTKPRYYHTEQQAFL